MESYKSQKNTTTAMELMAEMREHRQLQKSARGSRLRAELGKEKMKKEGDEGGCSQLRRPWRRPETAGQGRLIGRDCEGWVWDLQWWVRQKPQKIRPEKGNVGRKRKAAV